MTRSGRSAKATAASSARRPLAIYLRAIVRRDWRAQLFATCGCAIAALIACFQFCVFSSFIAVAYVVPQRLDADVWIMASGVSAFDFPHPIAEDYGAGLARFFPGATLRRIQVGFTTFSAASGRKSSMVAVGYDGYRAERRSFIADRTDLVNLEAADGLPELGGVDFRRVIPERGLAGFLGAPYLLMSLRDANAVLRQSVDRGVVPCLRPSTRRDRVSGPAEGRARGLSGALHSHQREVLSQHGALLVDQHGVQGPRCCSRQCWPAR